MKFKCPHCNILLEPTECYDTEFNLNNTIYNKMLGVCPECERQYSWVSAYKYFDSFNLELIS